MHQRSENWKNKAYLTDTIYDLKIYINGIQVNPKYILGLKPAQKLFSKDMVKLGSVSAQSIELKLYNKDLPEDIGEIFIETGIDGEMIPAGYFYPMKDPDDKDDNTLLIKAIDNMGKFKFKYDGSHIVPCTLKVLLQDICDKAGVKLGTATFLNEDVIIAVYDNTVEATEYLSYISEQAGGFACIGRDGQLYIKDISEPLNENIEKILKNATIKTTHKQIGKIDNINGNIYQNQTTQGRNICPTDIFMWEPGHYSVDGSKGNNSYRIRLKNLVKVTSNTTYYSNLFETTLSPRACFLIRSFDANSKFVRNIGIINPNTMTSFSTNENEVFLGITIADLVGTAYPSQQLFDFVNDGTIKPFICLNSESDKMFEEFIPNSPSPDYPSLTETATGDININVFNRNLLIEQGLSTPKSNTDFWHTPNSNFINFTPLKDGWGKYELDNSKGNTSLYASAFIKLGNIRNIKPNTLYTFLIEFRNINIDGIVDFLINDAYGANISYFSRLAPINDIKNSTIKNVKTAISIQDLNTAITSLRNVANFTAGSSGSFEARVMIVEGTFTLEEIGEYVEYKSQNYLLSLGNIELCKIGEKKDRIYKQNNKWYLEKNTCRYVLDGVNNSFNRDPLQTGLQYYSFYTLAFSNFIKPSSIILCSHLKQQNRVLYEDIEGITVNSSGAIRIKLLKSSVTTVAQLLSYLQSNAFEIICELTQSITTEITDEILLQQLEELHNIELFQGINHIAINNELLTVDLNYSVKELVEIPMKPFQKFKFAEWYKCSRIIYEDGIRQFSFGEETNRTIYINPNNMFIVNEMQVQKIYNKLNGLELYGFEGIAIVDPAHDIGDIVYINGKPVVYQFDLNYIGKFKGTINSKIASESIQEAMKTTLSPKEHIRRFQSTIDQVEGSITLLSEEIGDYEGKLTEVIQHINGTQTSIEIKGR